MLKIFRSCILNVDVTMFKEIQALPPVTDCRRALQLTIVERFDYLAVFTLEPASTKCQQRKTSIDL